MDKITVSKKTTMDEKKKILSVKDLSKYFTKSGKIYKVLDEVTFDIYEGDFFGVIGESGSGKSTTGKCVIRLHETNGGTVTFLDKIINNKRISKNSKLWLTRNMQMIFQDPMSSLNGRKNVMSLISEPIKINGNLKKEIKETLSTCKLINPYFHNTFQWQDYNLNEEYLIKYFDNVKQHYQKTIDALKNIDFVNKYGSIETLIDDLLTISNKLESNLTKELEKVFALLEKTKELIYINKERLLKHEIDEVETEYVEAEEKLKNDKLVYKKSREWINLRNKKEELLDEKRNIEDKIKYQYKEQNFVFLSSLIADYKSKAALYKQKRDTTKDLFYYSLNKIKVAINQDIVKIMNKIQNDSFLSVEDIKKFNQIISEKVSDKYKYLIEQITILSDKDEKLNQDLLDSLDEKNKQLHLSDELTDWFASYKKINKMIDEKINEDFLVTSKTIKNTVNDYAKKSREIEKKLNAEIEQKREEIKKIDNELKKITITYKESKTRLRNYEKLNRTKKFFTEKKYRWNDFVDLDNEYFKVNCLNLIHDQKLVIKNSLKDIQHCFKDIKKCMNDVIKNAKSSHLKTTDVDFKNNFMKLKTEIKNRINGLITIHIEQDSILEKVALYKTLRTKNKLWLNLNRRYLNKIIISEKVFDALNEVGLKNEHAFRYPHEFSGGQRQRIVIARSLISKPKFIIADEPISALDVSIQAQVINIMKRLSETQGITFMFIAHDLSMVNFLCNRLIILHKGKIVEKGDTNEIFKNPVHPYTISLLKASPELSKIHVDLSSFDLDLNYDKGYSIHNPAQFYKVPNEKDHYVYCSKDQFTKWVK